MTCEEFTHFLDDYVAGQVRAERAARFEEHLAICQACVDYLASYRATIRLGKQAFQDLAGEVPEQVPEELVEAVLAARRK